MSDSSESHGLPSFPEDGFTVTFHFPSDLDVDPYLMSIYQAYTALEESGRLYGNPGESNKSMEKRMINEMRQTEMGRRMLESYGDYNFAKHLYLYSLVEMFIRPFPISVQRNIIKRVGMVGGGLGSGILTEVFERIADVPAGDGYLGMSQHDIAVLLVVIAGFIGGRMGRHYASFENEVNPYLADFEEE